MALLRYQGAMERHDNRYHKALAELAGMLQVTIYKRESSPLRDRHEATRDLKALITEIELYERNGKLKWRKGLLGLAAYAIFAAVADE